MYHKGCDCNTAPDDTFGGKEQKDEDEDEDGWEEIEVEVACQEEQSCSRVLKYYRPFL